MGESNKTTEEEVRVSVGKSPTQENSHDITHFPSLHKKKPLHTHTYIYTCIPSQKLVRGWKRAAIVLKQGLKHLGNMEAVKMLLFRWKWRA